MKDIWDSLVKDPSETISQHFDEILTDLLENILTKEWRVREASCSAIGDLLQGRELKMVSLVKRNPPKATVVN